ncbi:hypothetical protein SEA_BEANWATER_96 [Mycobacterium phage BeanWater]|nr:hypothetical protein SEA_BEANWATER_96 [Mycobacterium phage BeanWater]QAY05057.1 hypothetical protein SEA_SHAQNATO_97 [Mycobacterium phage Shaqnato]QDP44458.1 hypothetical protein SEA_GRUNGLE_92 [Mycobacterium phage Grungle]
MERYLFAGSELARDELEKALAPELDELNAAQGTKIGFDEYLAAALNTGTITEIL